ncbi:MAG: hydrogenase formation protein HypD [Sulfolobales archaeon]
MVGDFMDLEKAIVMVFREDAEVAKTLVRSISSDGDYLGEEFGGSVKIMNFCGTHEWTTTHYGLRSLMPQSVELVAGPGCPVCITPSTYVEELVRLSLEGVRVYTFGDAFKLPSNSLSGPRSLFEAQALGGNVKVVYSFLDAVRDAKSYGRESVFFGIGFETTAPSYALLIRSGDVPKNLKLVSALRLTPPVMRFTVELHRKRGLLPIRGVIAPGHVSTITGAVVWEFLPKEFNIPAVVSGFEPIDVLIAISEILKMLRSKRPSVVVEYRRLVRWEGSVMAKKAIEEVFDVCDAVWRGIGLVPMSGLELKDRYGVYDAVREYGLRGSKASLSSQSSDVLPGCRCSEVVVGIAKPAECPLFLRRCRPETPYGPCMVSSEGTCRIWASYGFLEAIRGY